jgi:Flp pilus assembly pilin Flp
VAVVNQPANKAVIYALILTLIAVLAVGAMSIVYANHVATASNRNWCSLVVTLDDAYRQQPPQSDLGRKIAADMHQLRARLHC